MQRTPVLNKLCLTVYFPLLYLFTGGDTTEKWFESFPLSVPGKHRWGNLDFTGVGFGFGWPPAGGWDIEVFSKQGRWTSHLSSGLTSVFFSFTPVSDPWNSHWTFLQQLSLLSAPGSWFKQAVILLKGDFSSTTYLPYCPNQAHFQRFGLSVENPSFYFLQTS